MTFTWFQIFNLDEFEALNLVSKVYTLELEGLGEKDFLVTKGNMVSVAYEGVMLSLGLNAENPFAFEGLAIYQDEETNDVYVGIEIDAD